MVPAFVGPWGAFQPRGGTKPALAGPFASPQECSCRRPLPRLQRQSRRFLAGGDAATGLRRAPRGWMFAPAAAASGVPAPRAEAQRPAEPEVAASAEHAVDAMEQVEHLQEALESTERHITAAAGSAGEAGPSGRRKRIAFFVEPSPFNHICGLTSRFQNTIRELRAAGDEVLVICPETKANVGSVTDYHGAQVHQIPGFVFIFYPVDGYRLSTGLRPSVWRRLREFKPDVLHVATPGVMVWSSLLYSLLLRVPLVLSYHTHIPRYIPDYTFAFLVHPMWALIRLWHRRAARTLATSDAMAAELTREGVPRVHVWQRGIDTETFHPRHRRREARARLAGCEEGADDPIVAYIGRLGAEKRIDLLGPTMERLRTPGARLALVGDGPQRAQAERELAGRRASFLGLLTGRPLWEAFASADVLFMPSESETLGFVALEAMASGVPVVAARAGGLPDIVEHGATGLLFEPGDAEAAAAALDSLLADPALRERMGRAARAEAERWGWAKATAALRAEYDALLAPAPARPKRE
eukprot:tig00000880_g5187.t2